MTLEDIKTMDKEMLSPDVVSKVTGISRYYISLQARENPSALGFPVSVHGRRTLIPRRAFIRYMEGG